MSTAREIIKKYKEESKFTPNWLDANQSKYYPEYSQDSKKWQYYWTVIWNFGIDCFSENEVEELVEELNNSCKDGWE